MAATDHPTSPAPASPSCGTRADIRLLFCTRALRLGAYGLLSVVLVLYLSEVGITTQRIGLLLSAALVGDIVVSLFITTRADRWGRRRMLVLGALLMLAAGAVFAATDSYWLLVVVAAVGIISPSGNEIGPFLSIEQAALSEIVPGEKRTAVFAWYHLLGSFSTAVGALGGGLAAQALHRSGYGWADCYRAVVWIYAGIGLALAALFLCVSRAVEAPHAEGASGRRVACLGLRRSRGIVLRLSALFSLDAFAGGFVVQSIVAYWFLVRFGVQPAVLGSVLFGANVLAGLSALAAAPLAARIGLINTMVFTHIPSNILLMLVPLMPDLRSAVLVLMLRYSISQMDVPTRQSYTMAVVEPDERSAASGVTAVARSVGASVSPSLAGAMLGVPALLGVPFLLSGALKIVYDLLLYRTFRRHNAPGVAARRGASP